MRLQPSQGKCTAVSLYVTHTIISCLSMGLLSQNSSPQVCTPARSQDLLSGPLCTLFMGFQRQEYQSGLPFPPPVDHILSELSTMTHLSWVALHGMAHSFTELWKNPCHYKTVKGKLNFIGKQLLSFMLDVYDSLCLMDYSPPGSSVLGILQIRTMDWVSMPSFRRSFKPMKQNPHLLHWQAGSLPLASPSLTTLKLLTVWITRNCGKFWKGWEQQTTFPVF